VTAAGLRNGQLCVKKGGQKMRKENTAEGKKGNETPASKQGITLGKGLQMGLPHRRRCNPKKWE